jgi:hypothetical protein
MFGVVARSPEPIFSGLANISNRAGRAFSRGLCRCGGWLKPEMWVDARRLRKDADGAAVHFESGPWTGAEGNTGFGVAYGCDVADHGRHRFIFSVPTANGGHIGLGVVSKQADLRQQHLEAAGLLCWYWRATKSDPLQLKYPTHALNAGYSRNKKHDQKTSPLGYGREMFPIAGPAQGEQMVIEVDMDMRTAVFSIKGLAATATKQLPHEGVRPMVAVALAQAGTGSVLAPAHEVFDESMQCWCQLPCRAAATQSSANRKRLQAPPESPRAARVQRSVTAGASSSRDVTVPPPLPSEVLPPPPPAMSLPPPQGPISLAQAGSGLAPQPAPASTVGGTTTCIICMAGDKSHVAVPCGHQCACASCSKLPEMKNCPICRKPTIMWMQVHVA